MRLRHVRVVRVYVLWMMRMRRRFLHSVHQGLWRKHAQTAVIQRSIHRFLKLSV